MTRQEFVDTRLARLYGGPAPAAKLLAIIPLLRTVKERQKGDNCQRALRLAEQARADSAPTGRERWDRMVAMLGRLDREVRQLRQARQAQAQAARRGAKIDVAAVKASDEDPRRGWGARRAIDGSVEEPAGYWLTAKTRPKAAWLELSLIRPTTIDRIVLFHQLEGGHYRSLDYQLSVRKDGKWQKVVDVKNNSVAGWIGHPIPPVRTDAVRLDITRSLHGDRMGVGEIEVRSEQNQP